MTFEACPVCRGELERSGRYVHLLECRRCGRAWPPTAKDFAPLPAPVQQRTLEDERARGRA